MATYPEEGKVTHPDDVGTRRMPARQTKVAGDVVSGPGQWELKNSDMRRLMTEHAKKVQNISGEDIEKAFGVGGGGAKILPITKD